MSGYNNNDRTNYTCFSTNISLIFILMYNLHVFKNSDILLASSLNIGSLVTFIFDPVLGSGTSPDFLITAIYICNTTTCSCYNLICSKSWLMLTHIIVGERKINW